MEFKELYAAVHGIIITLVYSTIKLSDIDGNLDIFSSSMILSLTLFLPFAFKSFKEIFSKSLIAKGSIFGLTQVLIYQTLVNSNVLNSMIASLFGGIVVTLGGLFFLKEKLPMKSYLGIFITFAGALVYFLEREQIISVSIFAFIAGLLQGTTTTLTRSNIKNNFTREGIILSNFFWGSLILTFFSLYKNTEFIKSLPLNLLSKEVIIVCSAIIIAQISLYIMMKFSSTQISASLSLTRVPTSLLIDVLIFSGVVLYSDILSIILIFIGIFITSFFKNSSKFQEKPNS